MKPPTVLALTLTFALSVALTAAQDPPFTMPRATTVVAREVRTLASAVTDDRKFKGGVISPRILIDNPYLDPGDPFFNIPRQIACLPDGAVAVASTAKLHAGGRFSGTPYASGIWRIAPDGAITALAARPNAARGRDALCGGPLASTSFEPDIRPMSVAPDGSLLFGVEATVLRLTGDGNLQHLPGSQVACSGSAAPKLSARFQSAEAAAQDPAGNVWVADHRACTLSRVAPDGALTTVLGPETMCPADAPERWIRGEFMTWDAVHDELVMSGTVTWLKSPKQNVYSMVYRVRPDGAPRRVFFGVKAGRAGQPVDGISGLALDAAGAIHIGAGLVRGSGYQVLRLNEATGTGVVVAGAARLDDMNQRDGPAKEAFFGTIRSMCFDPGGTLYLNDANHVIRKLTPAGAVTTWAF